MKIQRINPITLSEYKKKYGHGYKNNELYAGTLLVTDDNTYILIGDANELCGCCNCCSLDDGTIIIGYSNEITEKLNELTQKDKIKDNDKSERK